MSVDEVAESAKLTVDILEELKNINNSGINRDELKGLKSKKTDMKLMVIMLCRF